MIFGVAEPTYVGTGWQNFRESFWPGIIVTVLYLGVIIFPRHDDTWALLCKGELNQLGDFLAGLFTPVAFGWLIYGYFLQRKEFRLQREELEETRKTLSKQVEVSQERADADRLRSTPNLSLQEGGVSGGQRNFILENFGGPARNMKAILWEESSESGASRLVRVAHC